MSAYRLGALDQKDARLREGLRIQLEAIKRMSERLREENIHFVVLMIPTTELVFSELVKSSQVKMPQEYEDVITNEEAFWAKVREFLKDHSIPSISALPALRESLMRGEQPYPMGPDGHPNAKGYRAIAQRVKTRLQELKIDLK